MVEARFGAHQRQQKRSAEEDARQKEKEAAMVQMRRQLLVFSFNDWENRCKKCYLYFNLCYCSRKKAEEENAQIVVS